MHLFGPVSGASLYSQTVKERLFCVVLFVCLRSDRRQPSNYNIYEKGLHKDFAQFVVNSRRMKRGGGGGAARQNGSDGRKQAEQVQREAEAGGFSFDPTDSQNGENDPKQRRELRSRYRELINAVQGESQDRWCLSAKGCC